MRIFPESHRVFFFGLLCDHAMAFMIDLVLISEADVVIMGCSKQSFIYCFFFQLRKSIG